MSKIRVSIAAGLDLVGDVDAVVVGRQRVARVELQHQPLARPAGHDDRATSASIAL